MIARTYRVESVHCTYRRSSFAWSQPSGAAELAPRSDAALAVMSLVEGRRRELRWGLSTGSPTLILRRMPVRVAVGTSHLVILFVTGVAVAVHLTEIIIRGQSPPWNIIAANVVAVLVGGQLAAWLAGRLAEERMRRALVSLLLELAAVTLYRAVRMAG